MAIRVDPLVIDIKGNSLDDGPGIRSVVFFKGCPLSCRWCHNPESQQARAELSHDPALCVGCGTCVDTCPEHACGPANPSFIDRSQCTRCFACVDACPSRALTRVGTGMTRKQIVERVMKDKPFYDTSGGGVTFSGGEPTLNMEFLSALMRDLKERGVHLLVETCGFFNLDAFRELVAPFADALFMDIKLIDPGEHKRWCGVDNAVILRNFAALHEAARGYTLTPRLPLIPGITDTEANLGGIAAFLLERGLHELVLLPNNPTWLGKNARIGKEFPADEAARLGQFMPVEAVARIREYLASLGVEARVG